MKFLIISHVKHIKQEEEFLAYAPYVREMNLWLKHVSEVAIVAPLEKRPKDTIDLAYKHSNIQFNSIPNIQFTTVSSALTSLFSIPIILWVLFKACKKADHIHLRCPGNIGLLGSFIQIFFPNKIKTAKYAGNWDPKSKQPISYKIQKNLLSSIFWTKNMSVLVYGDWKNQSKNIKSFFTASYSKSEIEVVKERDYCNNLNFVFVGSLVHGKRPLLSIQVIEDLHKKGINATLNIYGEGILKNELKNYCLENSLEKIIRFHGNQEKEIVKDALKAAHFLILPSKSEGWPKAIAEAMFFGVIPISTGISCVPYMLNFGARGILIKPELKKVIKEIEFNLKDNDLVQMSKEAASWSQQYTIEIFEGEIKKLLIN